LQLPLTPESTAIQHVHIAGELSSDNTLFANSESAIFIVQFRRMTLYSVNNDCFLLSKTLSLRTNYPSDPSTTLYIHTWSITPCAPLVFPAIWHYPASEWCVSVISAGLSITCFSRGSTGSSGGDSARRTTGAVVEVVEEVVEIVEVVEVNGGRDGDRTTGGHHERMVHPLEHGLVRFSASKIPHPPPDLLTMPCLIQVCCERLRCHRGQFPR
jgi:hypothetical protein